MFISVSKPGKLSESVELSLTADNGGKLKCLSECQTPSECLMDVKSSFSFHMLEEEGKIPVTEQLEGFSNALGVVVLATDFY